MPPDLLALRFIDVEIEALFDRPPVLSKKPKAPNGFVWNGETFRVQEVLSSWFDYSRRGRMARNMQPAHSKEAARRGSWGVGRFYFRVKSNGGRLFDLYYDRAPAEAGDRAGHWVLFRELKASP
jgi:hypothetical protein